MLGMAALFLVNSCQKQELQPDPVLKLNVSVVTVGQDGGPRSVVYQVENPVEGTEVSASTAESWIQDLTVNPSESSITFNVEANTGSEREGVVTVSYSGAEDVTFTVKQAVYVAPVGFPFETVALNEVVALPVFNVSEPVAVHGDGCKVVSVGTRGVPFAVEVSFAVPPVPVRLA